MDILAHGIYSVALNKTIEKRRVSIREIGISFFWGTMPDLLALGPSLAIGILNGTFDHHSTWNGFDIASILYSFTHSLVIFSIALGIAYLLTKKLYIPLLGWGLHILMDIPFHTSDFYPTPFLYPISSYTLPFGINWHTPIVWISLWLIGISWLFVVFYRKNK